MALDDARLPERFWAKVSPEPNTGCWLWVGSLTTAGYGQLWNREVGRPRGAHRMAYVALVGPVPSGLELDHLCRVRSCVNPQHLEPVTRRENVMRSPPCCAALKDVQARKRNRTACPQGHPYSGSNLYIDNKRGKRGCRLCRRAATLAHRRRGA